METNTEPAFKRLAALDCSKHVEKKGKFSYLSWPWAVRMLRETDPKAVWEVRRFDGLPYLTTDCGVFVEVAVTVDDVTLSQIHPVLNGQNKPISKPTSFDINTSIQRCLVKAIALHGLGLYVYAGEDLPEAPENASSAAADKLLERPTDARQEAVDALAQMSIEDQQFIRDAAITIIDAHEDGTAAQCADDFHFDSEQKLAVWSLLPSQVRTAIKKAKINGELATQP